MSRPREARSLSKNKLLDELLDEYKDKRFTQWEKSKTPEQREQLFYEVRAVESIRRHVKARAKELIDATTSGSTQ
jgi:hypothetical protein